jgi:hypothetical protein
MKYPPSTIRRVVLALLVLAPASAAAQQQPDGQASAVAARADSGLVRLPPRAGSAAAQPSATPAPAADATSAAAGRGLVRMPARTPSAVREAADRSTAFRVLVSVDARRLWLVQGRDTLFRAPIAVGTGRVLRHGDRAWRFETPRSVRRVLAKQSNPVWVPPDWHYAELAADSGWTLVPLERGRPVRLPDGSRVEVRGERVAHVRPGGGMEFIPEDEEVVFGTTLYMPPVGTANRRVPGELGAYKLELGNGYMLHGTPHKDSIGQAATHGCIRLDDDAIAYLYRTVPVGTPVYIF